MKSHYHENIPSNSQTKLHFPLVVVATCQPSRKWNYSRSSYLQMGIKWNNHQLPVQQPRTQGVPNYTCYLVGLPHFQTHPRLLYWNVKTGCLRPSIFNGQSIFCYTARFALDSGRLSKPKQGDAWSSSGGCPTIFQWSLYIYMYVYIYVSIYVYI